jgi:hypothetical protein
MRAPDASGATSLYIGMPAYDGVTAATVTCLLALTKEATRLGMLGATEILSGVSLLEYARAILARKFLDGGHTHWLMVDADMEFAPDVVLRMLAADVDVIGVSYARKRLDLDAVRSAVLAGASNWRTAGSSVTTHDLGSRVEVVRGAALVPSPGWVGTGLLLVKRHVIEQMWAAHPELIFTTPTPDGIESLCLMFRSDVESGTYVSEDVGFCHRWRNLGGAIHLLLDAEIGHHGSYCYRSNLADLYAPPKAPPVMRADASPAGDMLASLQRIAAMADVDS